MTEETRQVLHDIGLNAYAIDAYLALLESGQMTALETSKKANVPYSKIYEALKSLKDKGWIKSVEGRPSKYYPIPPTEALTTAKLGLEDRYKGWEHTITHELQPLYEKRELVERPDVLILHGQRGVMTKLEEILKRTTKEIMIAAPEFAKNMIGTATVYLETLQKTHLDIRLMVTGKAQNWIHLKRSALINELRTRDQMFGGGIIADRKEAVLFLGEEKPTLVIWSNHVGLVRFARDYFQFLWDSSKKI